MGTHGLGNTQSDLPLNPGKAGAAEQVLAKPGKILFSLWIQHGNSPGKRSLFRHKGAIETTKMNPVFSG
jgi:hypothetical protein